ncbi:uncharacterized protein isoform X8 [Macaca fascicularis]|uniref:uncharacterized protein isoform X8 n=1 Tax=Macaca fascicularis TaxID=9541 RepID=UPI003D15A04C
MMGSWGVGRGKTTLTAPVWPHTQFISTLSTLGIDLSGSSWGLSLPPLPTRGPGHPGTPKRGLYLRAASNKNDGRDEEQPANGIVRVACEVGERRESNLGRVFETVWFQETKLHKRSLQRSATYLIPTILSLSHHPLINLANEERSLF